jgi:large subunit ribosomal protein L24e
MVVKRSCSFCAGEIEPGTGTMFVKRDGAVFHFCSSSCRKQQLHLGRVGHRLKWTRAHAVKRQTEQSSAAGKAAARAKTVPEKPVAKPAAPKEPAPAATPPTAEKAPAETAAEKPAAASSSETPATPVAPAAPARKPRTKKPKEPAASE